MSPRPTLYVLDAYSRIYQVYHAIRGGMVGPAGQPTHAVFGLFRDLLNLAKERKPDILLAAFEGGDEEVFRNKIFAEYKQNRSAMPDDLRAQIPVILQLFEAFGVPVLSSPTFEADDVIATVARRAVEAGFDVTILTADKDARQLLGPHVQILNLRDGKILDVAALQKAWGITPEQVVDFLALTGDASDNVPGVPGIGEGTAKKLLQAYPSLEAAIDRIDEVGKTIGKARQERLREHVQTAQLAQSLVELREDVPIELDWEALRYQGFDPRALKQICIDCGFHRFLDELGDPESIEEAWPVDGYQVIDTPEAFESFLEQLRKQKKFSFDTETTSRDPLRADVVGYAFSWSVGEAFYVPVRGPAFDQVLDPEKTLEALRPILTDPSREIVGQNLKYDMLVLQRAGLELGGAITDTMVLSYLLESGERNHNLDELSRRLLDHTMIPTSDLIGKGKKQITMDQVDVGRVGVYACEDADATWRLEAILMPRIQEESLGKLYEELERPLIAILAGMEAIGIKVDVPRLKALSDEFAGRLEAIRASIFEHADREFNINSGPQLRQVLFDDLKLPVIKRTPKGEPSTDAEVLEQLAPRHPLPRLIVEYRQLDKLKGTYLDALPALVHPDGRIHASFNQVVTATGRLSSSEPNLQNIPVRTEDGRQIRQAFVAGQDGWSLLVADYSQVELRVLAHYSKDPELMRAFAEDQDIHAVVASEIFGVPIAEVNAEQRRMAKTVNFGVIYGLSAFGLASRLGIKQEEASAFIEAYFQKYAGVDRFLTETLESAQAHGRVETILGRRRTIQGVKSTTGRSHNVAERTAINTVIQGSAADLIKRAMLLIDDRLRSTRLEARLLLQIHDELVFEAPDSEIEPLAELVEEAMATALKLDVPLKVELGSGPNWLDLKPLANRPAPSGA